MIVTIVEAGPQVVQRVQSEHRRAVVKISYPLCVVVVVVAMLQVGGGQAAAQVELTATGSYISIPGGAWGIGGRIGVPLRESFDRGIRLEGVVDYFWPDCTVQECDLLAGHLDVVVQNRIGSQALGYFGAGVTYENYSLIDNGSFVDDTGWGANFVVGSRTQSQGMVRPFVEVRWILISDIRNQFTFTLGAALVMGG